MLLFSATLIVDWSFMRQHGIAHLTSYGVSVWWVSSLHIMCDLTADTMYTSWVIKCLLHERSRNSYLPHREGSLWVCTCVWGGGGSEEGYELPLQDMQGTDPSDTDPICTIAKQKVKQVIWRQELQMWASYIYVYCILRGCIKGTASVVFSYSTVFE